MKATVTHLAIRVIADAIVICQIPYREIPDHSDDNQMWEDYLKWEDLLTEAVEGAAAQAIHAQYPSAQITITDSCYPYYPDEGHYRAELTIEIRPKEVQDADALYESGAGAPDQTLVADGVQAI